jgi:hypothetical protein
VKPERISLGTIRTRHQSLRGFFKNLIWTFRLGKKRKSFNTMEIIKQIRDDVVKEFKFKQNEIYLIGIWHSP